MNLEEIDNTIAELEKGATTYATCDKLASLYIVRNFITTKDKDDVVVEYNDILPSYSKYVECKRNYQLNRDTLESVENAFRDVLREIYEFIDTLYIATENTLERTEMMSMIEEFKKTRIH